MFLCQIRRRIRIRVRIRMRIIRIRIRMRIVRPLVDLGKLQSIPIQCLMATANTII